MYVASVEAVGYSREMRVTFEGGPRNGEAHDVSLIGTRLVFPGNVEDRRPVYFEDEDRWGWSYPLVVYRAEYISEDEAIGRYSHTEPA